MSLMKGKVKQTIISLFIFCFCILTACSNENNIESSEGSKTTPDTQISHISVSEQSSTSEGTTESTTESSENTTSEYISNTSESTTNSENPEPHKASWIDPVDPDLYDFTPEQRQVYNVIVEGIKNNISTIAMPCDISFDEVTKIYNLVRNNLYEYSHLEIDGNSTKSSNGKVVSISINYKYDAEQVEKMKNELSNKADQILSHFSDGMSDWDKIKYIHDYIALNCKYDESGKNKYSAYGAIIDGKAICEGYSKAMAYLCNKAGIESMLVTGHAGGDEHMWNMVKYNGNWYHIDLTWDDPYDTIGGTEYVKYKYFNITNSEVRIDHKIIPDNDFFEYPQAVANEGNYYIVKGAYIKTYDEARKILVKQIANCVDNNIKYISVKVATQTLYNDIVDNIANATELSYVLREANDISDNDFKITDCTYSNDENGFIISIYIKELSPKN